MLAGKVLGLWGVGPLTTDPAKPQTCTHMSGYTQNRMTPQGAHLPSCPRPAVWWLPWAPWADSPTCVCVCVSPSLGSGMELGGKAKAHQGCSPLPHPQGDTTQGLDWDHPLLEPATLKGAPDFLGGAQRLSQTPY